MKIPFAIESYQSRALQFSAQRCVNYFAEIAPQHASAKDNVVLYNSPGIKAFASGLAGSIRGSYLMGGVLYVVAGNSFSSLSSAGVVTLIGSINTSNGEVSMASNLASPQELCFVDGTDGWIYDTSGGLVQIVDGDFFAADTVTFQDGYFIFNRSGTSEFFISNLNNGKTFTATDIADAEASPDECKAVFSYNQEVWVYGEVTIEVYTNTGNADFPFERIAGVVVERGIAAPFSIAAEDGSQFWLADDRTVRRGVGYTPKRISTHAIEEDIRKMSSVSDAHGYFVTISGHKFYHLVFPTGQRCYVYDIATELWHERESFDAQYFRGRSYVSAYDKHLVGDAFQGRMGELDVDTADEFGTKIQGLLTGPAWHEDRRRVAHRRVEIDFESGVGTTTGPEPFMWLDYSNDGGHTFSARKPARSMGKIGERLVRARWSRLGASRERVYRLSVAAAVKRSIFAAHLNREERAH